MFHKIKAYSSVAVLWPCYSWHPRVMMPLSLLPVQMSTTKGLSSQRRLPQMLRCHLTWKKWRSNEAVRGMDSWDTPNELAAALTMLLDKYDG